MLVRVIAESKDCTECYAEIIDHILPINGNRVYAEPISGVGYFCDAAEIVDINEAWIDHKCLGGSIVKVRLKGEEK